MGYQNYTVISPLKVSQIAQVIAEKAGAYKRTIRSQDMDLDDCIIAATALMQHAILATGNIRHYPMTHVKKTFLVDETQVLGG
ncbi:MAG TPA: hypothetical protein VEI57_14495 [Nitrospirota bacterium]|nr:hypothetical protein [Nitrospirota bacterium]